MALVIVFLLLRITQTATAAVPAGEVIAFRGRCFAVSGGRQRLLTIGAVVGVGDTVQTAAGARLKLRMSDGSIISVASGSEVMIRDYAVGASGQRINAVLWLGLGVLRALVTAGSSGRFEVEASVGVAAARSSDWFISVVPGAAQVGVLSGTVVLTSRTTGRSVTIPARWGTRLEAGLDPVSPRTWSPEEFDNVIDRTNMN